MKIKLIAFDLDGTLLNSQKQLAPGDAEILKRAADAGAEIVPATGRFLGAIPEFIRKTPFIRYYITANGAQIFDMERNFSIARSEIPLNQALDILKLLDELPVIYDCFMEDWGWMNERHYKLVYDYALDAHYLDMLINLRRPVPNLAEFIKKRGRSVQKIQCLFLPKDMPMRAVLLKKLASRFPGTVISTSIKNNLEINNQHANKGEALKKLTEYLGISMKSVLAFGDGLNDISMIKAAGIGVAMTGGYKEACAAADYVTSSCDESGVAKAIKKFCFEE